MASIADPKSEFKKLAVLDQITCLEVLDKRGLAFMFMAAAQIVVGYNANGIAISLGRLFEELRSFKRACDLSDRESREFWVQNSGQ